MSPSTTPAEIITVTGSGRTVPQQEVGEIANADTEGILEAPKTPLNKPACTAKRKLDVSPTVENPTVSPPKRKRKGQDDTEEDSEYRNSSDTFLAKMRKYQVSGTLCQIFV